MSPPSKLAVPAAAFIALAAAAFAEEAPATVPAAERPVIHSVIVDGRTMPVDLNGVRTHPEPDQLVIDLGSAADRRLAPVQVRYMLEGWDRDWQVGVVFMFVMASFCDESGDKIAQQQFNVSGDSPGWTGWLETSRFIHRLEKLVVPPGASRLRLVMSSAGPPAAVGVYVVDHLMVSRRLPDGGAQELFGPATSGESAEAARDRIWKRDGTAPSMAKLVAAGGRNTKAFEILDKDPWGHAEWHSQLDAAAAVTAGEQLVIEWDEMYSVGLADVRSIAYDRLPPGRYCFRMGKWSAMGEPLGPGVSLPIFVPQALWKQGWFWPAVAILFSASLAFGVRYLHARRMRAAIARLESHRLMEQERLRIARDIHDDMGARVSEISMFSAMAQRNAEFSDKARADFARISDMSRELVASLYEIVWAVNPDNDNLEELGNYLCQIVGRLCEVSQLRRHFDVGRLPEEVEVSSQIRHNIVMAVKEAVHNAARHAKASEIRMEVSLVSDQLHVSIRDDGCGFDGAETGHGLQNIRRRMAEIGGHCMIESRSGCGTTVCLRLAVKRGGYAVQTEPKRAPEPGESSEAEEAAALR